MKFLDRALMSSLQMFRDPSLMNEFNLNTS